MTGNLIVHSHCRWEVTGVVVNRRGQLSGRPFRHVVEVASLAMVIILILGLLLASPRAAGADLTADEIIRKCDQLLRGKTTHGTSQMHILTPEWPRSVSMEFWSSGSDRFFIHITAPPREKGITFLKVGNLLYQWLPSAEQRIKITPSMMLQSWMGSDFTNDDLVKESDLVNDYRHRLLGKDEVDGVMCYMIESIPRPDAPIVWGKLVLYIRMGDLLPARQEYFSESGELMRTMYFSDFKKTNDRIYPMKWVMVPHNKPGHTTTYQLKSIVFDQPIDPATFTIKNLSKPR